MPATVRFDSSPALARAGRCQRARALRWRGWQPTDRTREEPRHRSRNRRLFAHSWSRKTQNHQRESKATPSAPRLPPDFRFGSSRTHSSTRGSGGARGHMTSGGRWRLTDRTRGEPRHRRRNWRFESNQARVHHGYRPVWPLPRIRKGWEVPGGQAPSDGAGGRPTTTRVINHGIGVAIGDFPHTHGVETL
jgi:hypothetical protein